MKVFLIAAVSLDGFIAQSPTQVSTAWTSKEDRDFFRKKTIEAGVIVMGRRTFDTVGRPLKNRLNIVMSREPKDSNSEQLIYTSQSPGEIIQLVEHRGYSQLAVCGGASVYTQFVKEGLIDEYLLTIEPMLMGEGVKLLSQEVNLRLKLIEVIPLSNQTKVFRLIRKEE